VMRAMARRLSRSASIRSMAALSSAGTGPLRGAATNRRPHPRQRKLGAPDRDGPLRTMAVPEQRGHGGGASGIRSGYQGAGVRATTRAETFRDQLALLRKLVGVEIQPLSLEYGVPVPVELHGIIPE
jgi:hypothetical protein